MLPHRTTHAVKPSLASAQLRQRFFSIFTLLAFGFSLSMLLFPPAAQGVSSGIVISQVYGGGGNSGSTLRNDFIELFNRGSAPVTMTNWSVQYATATGSSWTVAGPLNGTLQPGQYWLIQLGTGGGGTTNLPTPDFTDTSLNPSATAGKIALVNNTTALSGTCPTGANIIDFVGYGSTANCSETAPTAAPSATNAVLRKANGCTETDNNASDYMTAAANPRNSATTKAPCVPPTISIDDPMIVEGNGGTQTLAFTVTLSYPLASGNVAFNYATADGTAMTINNDYVAAAMNGVTISAGTTSATINVTINGDTAVEPDETVLVNLTGVSGATVAKAQGVGTIKNDDAARIPPTATVGGGGAICPGGTATIQAALTGAAPWNVTWSDGVTQTGVTTSPATRTVSPAMMTIYTVTAVSDLNFGNGTSSGNATVTVNANPDATITAPTSVCANATGNQASVPDAGAGAMYTWSISGGTITNGQNTRNLMWTASASGTAMLSVIVKNNNGCSSQASANVTINPATAITATPQALTVCTGQSATFSVTAIGTNLTYQWRKGSTNIANETNPTFTLLAVTTADAGSYSVVVTGDCGVVTSTAVSLTVTTAPTVTTQPTTQVVAPGATPSFTAAASGTAPITRQWQVSTDNGAAWADIPGATAATLTLPAATLAENGKQYRVQFTNVCGTVNSNAALLSVLPISAEILDPLVCVGDGTTLDVKAQITNTSAVAVNGVFRAQLDTGLVTRNSSCVITGGGTCSFTGNDRVRWSGTIAPNQTITIQYQVQVEPNIPNGTDLCINSTFEFNGGNVATVRACTRVTCAGPAAPGFLAPESALGDTKPGSVLFFNFYSSDVSQPQLENTRFNITNTDVERSVILHLFFVNAADCRPADTFFSFLASEYDPGEQGFLLVVAVDAQRGCPINFNRLIGSEFFKLKSGHAANLGAITIAALPGGPMACDPTETTARLDFDGTDYNQVPRALAVDNLQSPLDGNNTLLILNRIGGNYSNGTATRLSDLLGLVYDDKEKGYSFQFDPSGCQYVSRITNGAPRTSPPLTTVIPRGHTGWMRLQHVTDAAMLGAVVNLNPNGFNQGHNLHALTYTDASITIPIFPPSCVP
jgi:Lamin Tail Domain/Calx-beta domain/PKD-like domain/Immunoglobulin I-set domain